MGENSSCKKIWLPLMVKKKPHCEGKVLVVPRAQLPRYWLCLLFKCTHSDCPAPSIQAPGRLGMPSDSLVNALERFPLLCRVTFLPSFFNSVHL